MRVIGLKVDGLALILAFVFLSALIQQAASGTARIVVVSGGVAASIFVGLASITLITDDGIRFLTPLKSRIDATEIEGVGAMPALTRDDTRQLCVFVDGRRHRVSNFTSRNVRNEFLDDFIRVVERRWLNGGPPPAQRWWPCW